MSRFFIDRESRGVRLVLFLALIASGGVTALGTKIYRDARSLVRTKTTAILTDFEKIFHLCLEVKKNDLSMAMETLLKNEAVIEAFAKRDRERLYSLTSGLFENSLKPKYGIDQFHFHIPPAVSFLRLHNPEKYGDDLTSYRPLVVAVNAIRAPVRALEVGKGGPGLRAAYPVFYQGEYVGSVEFGASIRDIVSTARVMTQTEFAIGFNRDVLARAGLARDPDTEAVNGNILYSEFSDAALRPLIPKVALDGSGEVVAVEERRYLLKAFPLEDYHHWHIGQVLVVKDVTALVADSRRQMLLAGVVTLPAAAVMGCILFLLTANVP